MGIAKEQVDGGAGGTGPITAIDVSFINMAPPFSNVDEALRYLLLLQNPITASLTGGGTFEIGQNGTNTPALLNVSLNWSSNKTGNIAYIRLKRGITVVASTDPGDSPLVLINTSDTSFIDVGANISANTTYTLTITSGDDPSDTTTASTSFSFSNRVFWGVSNLVSDSGSPLSEAQIESIFSTELRNNRNFTKTVSPSTQYMYFVVPTAFGSVSPTVPNTSSNTPEFIVSGFSNNAWTTYQVSITNAYGYNQNYYVFRSTFLQNATHTVQILN